MTQIGKYVVVRELGHGGMGVVFEARDPALDRAVAVKLVSGGGDPERFLREARAAARVIHPNCVPIFDMGEHAGSPFLVMELVVGMSASDFLERRGTLAPKAATEIAAAACRGLAAVHAAGLIHRDIKPSNLLISKGGTVKVADFGLARVVDSSATTLTGDRAIGTPHFMSPEQCYAEPTDARSDIYSLGATYYVLLTGRYPFRGDHDLQIMFAHCNDAVPDPRAVVPSVPEACARIVRRAMAKSPADRYQTAQAMLADLEAAIAADPGPGLNQDGTDASRTPNVPARQSTPPMSQAVTSAWQPGQTATGPVDSRPTRRRWLLGLPALAAAGVGGYVAFQTAGGSRDNGPKGGPGDDTPKTPVLVPVRNVGARVGVLGVAVSDDGRWLAVALSESHDPARGGGVKLYDRAAGDAPEVWWKWRDISCNSVAFSPDGKLLVVGFSGNGRLRVWSMDEDKEVAFPASVFEGDASGNVVGLAFSPDGKLLAAGTDGWATRPGRVRVWRVADRTKVRDLTPEAERPPQAIRGIAFGPDGKTLAAAVKIAPGSQPLVDVWDAESGSHIKTLLVTQATLGPCVAFARNEPLLAYTSKEDVQLSRPLSFKPDKRFITHNNEPSAVALSPDGGLLAFSVGDTIELVDTATEALVTTLRGQTGQIYSLAFTADGATLISGSESRTVHEWPVPPRTPRE